MGYAKRKRQRKQLENESKSKISVVKNKISTNYPDLTIPRKWLIMDYNDFTKTYLISTVVDEKQIISCLSCKLKLEENAYYLAYKNMLNKELVIIEQFQDP